MTSTRERIVSELVRRLKTPPTGVTMPPALAAERVHRYSLRPIEAEKLPALVVYRFDNKPTLGNHLSGTGLVDNLIEYEVSVRVEVRALGEPVDQVVEAFEEYVRQVVFIDPSLGGLAMAAREIAYEVDGALLDRGYAASYISLGFLYVEQPYVYTDPAADLVLVEVDNLSLEETFQVPE